MIPGRIAAFCLCILFASASVYADDTGKFAYAWPLTTDSASAAWQIEPSAEIYAASIDPQLRDLEVVDGDGNPVPMAQRGLDSTQSVSNWTELPLFVLPVPTASANTDAAVNLRIERGADGSLRSLDAGVSPAAAASTADFILDASKLDASIDALRVDWDSGIDTLNAQFSISGSDDLQNWHVIEASASVLGLTQAGNQLSRHEIPLGTIRIAYLRLHRLDSGEALPALRVSARKAAVSTALRAARQWLSATLLPADTQLDQSALGTAVYRYRLPAAVVGEALKLELASDNSIATLHVASRNGNAAWLPRAQLTAFRLREDNNVIGNDEIAIEQSTRVADWRVEATPPLDRAPSLSIAWRPARFIFLAQGHGPYRLIAGSASVRRAEYPLDIALSELRSRLGKDWQPPLASTGTRAALAGVSALTAQAPPPKPHDWKAWLLWAVLIGAAGVIGYLALSLLRKPSTNS